jgi:hypothetical protein
MHPLFGKIKNLGIDGVIVNDFTNGKIFGSGEWIRPALARFYFRSTNGHYKQNKKVPPKQDS